MHSVDRMWAATLILVTALSNTVWCSTAQAQTVLQPVELGRCSGGRLVINAHLLPDTVYRLVLTGTVSLADTTWDLVVNGRSTTIQPGPAPGPLASQQEDLLSRVRAKVDSLRNHRATGRPMAVTAILDSFVAEIGKRTDLVRKAERVSDVAFEICWKGEDDCERYGLSGTRRLVPASTIRRMLVEDARLIRECMKQGRLVVVWPSGVVIPRLETREAYLEQYSR